MALDDAELKIVLKAVATDLLAGMEAARASVQRSTSAMRSDFQQTEQAVTKSVDQIRERVTIGFGGVQGTVRAFGDLAKIGIAIFATYRSIKAVTEATQEWGIATEHTHDALNLSWQDTATLNIAVQEAGGSIEQFDQLIKGLGKNLISAAGDFANLDVVVRDGTGAYLPLFTTLTAIVKKIDEYKAGTDQLVIAQRLLGAKGATSETIDTLRKTVANFEHAAQVAKDFGLVIGEDGVAKTQDFTRAQADLGFALLAVQNVLGTALRPEIQRLLEGLTSLAKDGSLQEWARDLASNVTGVGEEMVSLGRILASHATAIEVAATAWAFYRTSLITTTELSAVLTFLKGMQTAWAGIAAATTISNLAVGISAAATASQVAAISVSNLALGISAAATTSASLSAGLGVLATTGPTAIASVGAAAGTAAVPMSIFAARVAAVAAAFSPATWVAILVGGGAAILTYTDKWKDLGGLMEDVAKIADEEATSALTRLNAVFDRLTASGLPGWLQGLGVDLHALSASVDIGFWERLASIFDRITAGGLPGKLRAAQDARLHPSQDVQLPTPDEVPIGAGVELPPIVEGKNAPPPNDALIAAQKKAYDNLKAIRDQDLQDLGSNEAAKLARVQEYLTAVRANGATEAQLNEAVLAVKTQQRKAEQQADRIAIIALKQSGDARVAALIEQQKQLEAKVGLGTISVAEAVRQEKLIAKAKLDIAENLLLQERALQANEPEARATTDAKILDIHAAYANELVEIDRKAAQAALDEWKTTAKEVEAVFSTLATALEDYLTILITGSTTDLSALRTELHSATVDVDYFRATNNRASDEAINAKQRQIDAQHQLNDAIEQQSTVTQAALAAERDLTRGFINLLEEVVAEFLKIQAIKALGGTPSTKEGNLSSQLAGAFTTALLGSSAPPATPGAVPEAGAGGGVGAGAPDPTKIASAQATQDAMTLIAGKGEATRAAGVQQGLIPWIATQAIRLGKWVATELGMTASTAGNEAARVGVVTGAATTKAAVVATTSAAEATAVVASSQIKSRAEGEAAEKSLLASAVSAAGKAYDAFANLPYGIGVALGAAAAVAVFAAVIGYGALLAFEQGGKIPKTGPVLAHEGEWVLTAEETAALEKQPGGVKGALAKMEGRGAEKAAGVPAFAGGGLVEKTGVALVHQGETVTPAEKGPTPGVREAKGDGPILHDPEASKADKEGEKKGGDLGGKGAIEALGAAASAAGAAAKGVGVGTSAGGGGGGLGTIQKVSVVSAPATLNTKVASGKITVSEPVGVSPGDGAIPVEDTATIPKNVTVTNAPLRVAFSAIQTTAHVLNAVSFAPFGIGEILYFGASFGALNAFEKGGYVPQTGPALVHEGEFVLTADTVRALGSKSGLGGTTALAMISKALTGEATTGILGGDLGIGGGAPIQISGPRITAPGFSAPQTISSQVDSGGSGDASAPPVIVNYSAWDLPTGRDQLDRHARHIAGIVAKEWAARPSPRGRP